jgi:hypothetical protein
VNESIRQKVRPWLSASVLVGVAALGFSVAQSSLGFLDYVRVELSSNAECCESFRAYQREDSGQRRYWVGVIDGHSERMRELEREQVRLAAEVQLLRENAKARSDPFTGSEGRDLERRIEQLETDK